jgi:hypothetical protein
VSTPAYGDDGPKMDSAPFVIRRIDFRTVPLSLCEDYDHSVSPYVNKAESLHLPDEIWCKQSAGRAHTRFTLVTLSQRGT